MINLLKEVDSIQIEEEELNFNPKPKKREG